MWLGIFFGNREVKIDGIGEKKREPSDARLGRTSAACWRGLLPLQPVSSPRKRREIVTAWGWGGVG